MVLQYFAENSEKPLVFLCFCIQSAQKPYKTCGFGNILLKMLKNHWFAWIELRLQKTLQNMCFLQYFAESVEKP